MKKTNLNLKKHLYIVITGLDGAGKTTLIDDLEKFFSSKGLKVKTAHSPYDEHLRYEVLPALGNDSHGDRLLFALDNHILGAKIREWLVDYDIVITQRGPFDSFVHGQVQGFTYEEVERLNCTKSLPAADIMVHLCASAEIAFERIKNDPDADKFEYLSYIVEQEKMTRKGYSDLVLKKEPALSSFFGTRNLFVDTTDFTTKDTFEYVIHRLLKIIREK